MSLSDSVGTGSTDGSSTSIYGREVCSFLEPRDPSITKPWMRPPPTHGTNLCNRFELDSSDVPDQHLKVYLRLKSLKKSSKNDHYYVQSRNSLVTIAKYPKTKKSDVNVKKAYNFTHIFDDTNGSQTEIFNHIIRDNLLKFVDGQDFTIMTYGASGSGKTYTLMGNEAEPGLIPRFLEALFVKIKVDRLPNFKPQNSNSVVKLNSLQKEDEIKVIQQIYKNCTNQNTVCDSDRQTCMDSYHRMSTVLSNEDQIWRPTQKKITKKYDAWVSFAEIYNENIFDLLRDEPVIANHQPESLKLGCLANNQSYIKGIRWVYVRNGEEAYAALDKGRCRLRYAHTNVNKQSSRSHSVFFLKIVQYDSDLSNSVISTFRLCDLAGSERAKKTGNEGVRLAESRKINTSLHVLERCLASLRSQQDGQNSLPPYRESKLTLLLQNALCGNESIAMIVNINPESKFFDETQHVLQFSSIAKKIIGYIEPPKIEYRRSKSFSELYDRTSNSSFDDSSHDDVRYLNNEIERMKKYYEELLKQKEKDIKQELTENFLNLNNKNYDDFEKRLKNDRKIQAEAHDFEIKRLKREMDCQQATIDCLESENFDLKKKVAILEKMNTLNTEITSSIEKSTVAKLKQTETLPIENLQLNETLPVENIQLNELSIKNFRLDETLPFENLQLNETIPVENLQSNEILPNKNLQLNKTLPKENIQLNGKLLTENLQLNETSPTYELQITETLTDDDLQLIKTSINDIIQPIEAENLQISGTMFETGTGTETFMCNNFQPIETSIDNAQPTKVENFEKIGILSNIEIIENDKSTEASAISDSRITDPSNHPKPEIDSCNDGDQEYFNTMKKKKFNSLLFNGALSVDGSKRKLYSRRHLDENAAENILQSKQLTFEEESPGAICAPKLEKPYDVQKTVSRSTRKKRK